jgi:hypothetical protein
MTSQLLAFNSSTVPGYLRNEQTVIPDESREAFARQGCDCPSARRLAGRDPESRETKDIFSGSRLASRKPGLGLDDELEYNGVAGYPASIRYGFQW